MQWNYSHENLLRAKPNSPLSSPIELLCIVEEDCTEEEEDGENATIL
jgi:hypothetical protein